MKDQWKRCFLAPTFTLMIMFYFFGCATYEKYKPDKKWYDSDIKSLEVHFQHLGNNSWFRRDSIKRISTEIIDSKGYNVINISEAKPYSSEKPRSYYLNKADAFMIVVTKMVVIEPKEKQTKTVLVQNYPAIRMFTYYHIFTYSPDQTIVYYGPPPPWSEIVRKGVSRSAWQPDKYAEDENNFIMRVLEHAFQNLPITK